MRKIAIPSMVLLLSAICAAQTQPEWHIQVSLSVSADGPLQNQIISYCTRELRSIKGIAVVEKASEHIDYGLEIVALSTSSIIAISATLDEPLKSLLRYADELPNSFLRRSLKIDLPSAVLPRKHLVMTSGTGKADQLCKDLIADLDGSVFQPNRRLVERN